jgi:hypothetical protein
MIVCEICELIMLGMESTCPVLHKAVSLKVIMPDVDMNQGYCGVYV